MAGVDIRPLELDGVFLITPKRFPDGRGFFSEIWKREALESAGLTFDFIQDNYSYSAVSGVVRGMHYQTPPFAQTKLVMVLSGRVIDAVFDLRRKSPTFGKSLAVELSAENGHQLLIPKGLAHGFAVVEPNTAVLYKVDAPYAPHHEAGIHFADPDLGIVWPFDSATAVLSKKDAVLPRLKDAANPF
jgi:dTDP-4-dehydrorhamnose 3,5-epimerase